MDEFAVRKHELQPLRPEDLLQEVDPPVLTICYNDEEQVSTTTRTGEVFSSTKMVETKRHRKKKKKVGTWQPAESEQLKTGAGILISQGTEITFPLPLPQLCLLRLHVPTRNQKQIEGKLRTPEFKRWLEETKKEHQAFQVRKKRKLECIQKPAKPHTPVKPRVESSKNPERTPSVDASHAWRSNLALEQELQRRNAELDYFLFAQRDASEQDAHRSPPTHTPRETKPDGDRTRLFSNSGGMSFGDNPFVSDDVEQHLATIRDTLDSFLANGK